jgi:phospholipid/cholesterol/gamma-HCH transport system substrate-binding protein
MASQGENNTKLGLFVLAGLIVLILSFYMIGKNRNLFGSTFELRSRFSNLNGLVEGSNVLFAGIQGGTVKKIDIIADTSIEVTMIIDDKVRAYIHKNALASIGTDGLMGNKVVNILPGNNNSPLVENHDLLLSQKMVNTDEMLQTLSKTNNNIAGISEGLKTTVLRINNSSVWGVLNDKSLGLSLKSSLRNINKATVNANQITKSINDMVTQTQNGKGTLGTLLSDTASANNLKEAIAKIKLASDNANTMTAHLNAMVQGINKDMANGKGSINTLLRDTVMAKNLKATMDNVQKGTDAFNQNMEALKHNFLFRGYFKRLEREQEKEKAKK